jgi:carboxylesterase
MIEINERFTVAAPPDEVYKVLSDPQAVVECVAGASLGEQNEDGTYVGTMAVKFSALRVSFSGKVGLDLDELNRSGEVVASGRDGQGGTKFKATATFQVTAADGGASSDVAVAGEVDLAGKLASVIENAAGAVVRRMTGEFIEALSVRCASGSAQLGPVAPEMVAVGPTSSGPQAGASTPDPAPTGPSAPAPVTPRVLLLHDFGGSPSGLRAWGEALAAGGAAVSIPRLPGHGTRWKDLDATTADDWYSAAQSALATMQVDHGPVVVMGLSLGATLALRLAEEHSGLVAGVVAVNPVITGVTGAKKLLGLRRIVRRSRPAVVDDARKTGVHDVAYDRVPLRAAAALIELGTRTQRDLHRVSSPVLLAVSGTDHVVDRGDSDLVWSGLAPATRDRVEFTDSYHLVPLDNDADRLFAASLSFVSTVAAVHS